MNAERYGCGFRSKGIIGEFGSTAIGFSPVPLGYFTAVMTSRKTLRGVTATDKEG